jgi:hypothetical protein
MIEGQRLLCIWTPPVWQTISLIRIQTRMYIGPFDGDAISWPTMCMRAPVPLRVNGLLGLKLVESAPGEMGPAADTDDPDDEVAPRPMCPGLRTNNTTNVGTSY